METEAIVIAPTKTSGQLFKEKHGYSRTIGELMRKYKVASVEEYKKIRKARKKKEAAESREKHTKAKALRGVKGGKK